LKKSLVTSMQTPLQSSCPTSQLQPPAEQIKPGSHTVPQPPQFVVSLSVSTQPPSHSVKAAGQSRAQPPALHTSLMAQAASQAPQWIALAFRFTQLSPHMT
jgi:hypothetical protein